MRSVKRAQITPTLDTAVYAANDQLSTLQTVTITDVFYGAELMTVTVLDAAQQKQPLDIFLFDRSVTVAADQAAATFSDADMVFCLGVINVLAADYDDVSTTNSIATIALVPSLLLTSVNRGRNVFAALVTRGTPTYAAGSLTISFNAIVDAS